MGIYGWLFFNRNVRFREYYHSIVSFDVPRDSRIGRLCFMRHPMRRPLHPLTPPLFPAISVVTDDADRVRRKTRSRQKYKVLLVGPSKVGKSSIIKRLIKDRYHSTYRRTLGVRSHTFECRVPVIVQAESPEEDDEKDVHQMVQSMTSFMRSLDGSEMDGLQKIPTDHFQTAAPSEEDPFDAMDEAAEFQHFQVGIGMEEAISIKMTSPEPDAVELDGHHVRFAPSAAVDVGDDGVDRVELAVTLQIEDVGFHHQNDYALWDDVSAVILVADYSSSSTLSAAVDKYESMMQSAPFMRWRTQSDSTYLPVVVAVNKCELKQSRKGMTSRDIRRVVDSKLQPVVDAAFPVDGRGRTRHNFTNMTVLQAPSLELLQQPTRSLEDESDSEMEPISELKSLEKAQSASRVQRRAIGSRRIDIISCSAKNGKNIEKVFARCLRKVVPSTLCESMTRSSRRERNATTAHVTAPIWLRQVVSEFESEEEENGMHSVFGNQINISKQFSVPNDDFTILGD